MIKNNKIYNYWKDDVYTTNKDNRVVSNIVTFIRDGEKIDLDQIVKNLKELDIVSSVKKEEDRVVVDAESNGVKSTIDLFVNQNKGLVVKEAVNTLKIEGANNGVNPHVLKTCIEKPNVLVSIAKFDVDSPFDSYYMQNKILASALEFEFIFDMSAKKIFPVQYIDYIDKVDSNLLVNSVYTILLTKDKWMTTTGLARFNLKELEINNVSDQRLMIALFKTLNNNRLLKGEILQDTFISYGGEEYFVVLGVDDVIKNISDKNVVSGKYVKGHESNQYRQVLIPFKEKDVDVVNLDDYVDISGFETESLNFEIPEFLLLKTKLCRQTLPYLFDFIVIENNVTLFVEFEQQKDDKLEYIYAKVAKYKNQNFEGELLIDSLHDSSKVKGTYVDIPLKRVINWEVHIGKKLVITPINAYFLKLLEKMKKNSEKKKNK